MCTVVSGRSTPEYTRTTEMRPTNGSVVVLMTAATSGSSTECFSGARSAPAGE